MPAVTISSSNFLNAFDYELVTVGVSVQTLTATKYAPAGSEAVRDRGKARAAFITVEGIVRYRIDGTAPTGDEGHELRDGDSLTIVGEHQLRNFKAIRRTDQGADAKLRVSYLR